MRPIAICLALAALAGACAREKLCPAGEALCGDACVALDTDAASCGACGVSCGPGGACHSGGCACAAAATRCGAACADLRTDPANCGACGAACAAALFCATDAQGVTACVGACPAGQDACGRACVDLAADALHCGACDRACGTGERCAGGRCLADLYVACGDDGTVREATASLAPAGAPRAVGALADRPIGLAWLDGALWAANSSGNTLAEIRFDLPAPTVVGVARRIAIPTAGFNDLEFVAGHGGLLYVSDASANNLVVVDPSLGVLTAASLSHAGDAWVGPSGIAFAGDKAYVALTGANAISVHDVSACQAGPPPCAAGCGGGTTCINGYCQSADCAREVTRIALPLTLTGSPMPSRIALAGGLLYVTLWNLDPTSFTPAGNGRLAVVDPGTDSLVQVGGGDYLDLGGSCRDPGGLAVLGSTLYVTCGFFPYSDPTAIVGAAIVPVDLSTTPPSPGAPRVLASAAPGAIAFCGGIAYAGDRASGAVLRYDPGAGSLGSQVLCPAPAAGASYVADVACAP